MDNRAMSIADGACAGVRPSHDDILYLLDFDARSPEAAYAEVRAREMALRASKGRGFVYAQIGVDANPCAENCAFCSFAAVNTEADGVNDAGESSAWEVPIDRIVSYARLFDEEGVHLISLMSTAGLPFSRYLEMVSAVRDVVSDDMPIMANAADMTYEQACALKEAGAQAIYHAIRLGEGELTDIDPDCRRATIAAARKAGLGLMTGIEPLWDGATHEEIASRIEEVSTLEPFCTGACSLIAAKGTEMEDCASATRARVRYVGAITRLVVGESVPVGGAGGIAWVDAGCDPRARKLGLEPEWLRREAARAKSQLEADEWCVPARAVWPY